MINITNATRLGIRGERGRYIKPGFLDDLVESGYCLKEELNEVLEEINGKRIDVVPVGEDYFIANVDDVYYLVVQTVGCFTEGCVESAIFKIERIRGNDLVMVGTKSDRDSELVQDLYWVVNKYLIERYFENV